MRSMVAIASPAPLTMQAISPFERDIVEIVLAGTTLHRIFLVRIAQLRDVGMAEHGVGVDVDLGVERHQAARLRDNQRVDLDEAGVLLHIKLVQSHGHGLELSDLRALQPPTQTPIDGIDNPAAQPPDEYSTVRICSGVFAATSSISMPPAAEAIRATRPRSRFNVRDR